jgi:hypothetical protein
MTSFFLAKWKTTSIFNKMGNDFNFFYKMEDNLNFLQYKRQLQVFNKMKDDLIFLQHGRRPQFFLVKQKTRIECFIFFL